MIKFTSNEKDFLTGAYTKGFMYELISKEIYKNRRYGDNFSLMLLDMDNFKEINDTMGHAKGDRVLVGFVDNLFKLLRTADSVSRWGGDEFLILLPYTGDKDALRVAKRIMDQAGIIEGIDTKIQFSLGIATYPQHGETLEKLLKSADKFLYRAKKWGKSRIGNLISSEVEINIPTPRFIGRDIEMEVLLQNIDSSKGKLTVISGPAGVGKSRFVAELLKRADIPYIRGEPFGPLRTLSLFVVKMLIKDVIRQYADSFKEFINVLSPIERGMLNFVAPTRGSIVLEDIYKEKNIFFKLLADLFKRVADKNKFAIIIEDIQWASPITLDFIQYFVLMDKDILFFTTERSEEKNPACDEMMENLKNRGKFDKLIIKPLSQTQTYEMLKEILGVIPSSALVRKIYQETNGIPFFVEEIIKHLYENTALVLKGKELSFSFFPEDMPKNLQGIIKRRLQSLDREELEAVKLLTIWGKSFTSKVAANLLGASSDKILRALEAKGIIELVSGDVYGFVDEITRKIVYADIPRGYRKKLHTRIAYIKEDLYKKGELKGVDTELAFHFSEGFDRKKAGYWCEIAGDVSHREFNAKEATNFYKTALKFVDDEKKKTDIVLKMYRSALISGNFAEIIPYIYDRINTSPYKKDELTMALGVLYTQAGEPTKGIKFLRDARKITKNREILHNIMFEEAWALRRMGRIKPSQNRVKKLLHLELSERLMLQVFNLYASTQLELGNHKLALLYYKKVIEMRKKNGEEILSGPTYINLALLYQQKGDFDTALTYYTRAISLLERAGNINGLSIAFNNMGTLHLSRNEIDEAENSYRRALELVKITGNKNNESMLLNNLGSCAREKMKYDMALNYYKEGIETAQKYRLYEWIVHIEANMLQTCMLKGGSCEDIVLSLEKHIKLIDIPREIIQTWFVLFSYYIEVGKIQAAKQILSKIEDKLHLDLKKHFKSELLIARLSLKEKEGDIKKALYYLRMLNAYYKKINEPALLADAYVFTGDFYKRNRREKMALKYYRMALPLLYETGQKEKFKAIKEKVDGRD